MNEVLVKEFQFWTPRRGCLELALPDWFGGACSGCPSSMVRISQSVEL
jgi:hypothetical protein